MKSLFRIGLLLAAVGVVGCFGGGERQQATAPADPQQYAHEEGAAETASFSTLQVYYGTNRVPDHLIHKDRPLPPEEFYGDKGALDLQYGLCRVSIPDTHQYGEVERPSIWKFEFRENLEKHVVLQSVRPYSQDEALAAIAGDIQKSPRRQAFVFIHGFNVTFAAAARRTAQMAYDLKFDGPPIFFSWPSQGRLSGYLADLDEADGAAQYLQQFLEQVAGDTGAEEVHVIAHSMGNRVLAGALDRMAADSQHKTMPHFNQILLAAPDIDAERFRTEIASRISSSADRLTIYASSNDKALIASKSLHRARRLGQGGDELTLFPRIKNIDVVDASEVDFGMFDLGHSAYGNELLMDIRQTLNGVPAAERTLEPHHTALAWLVQPGQILQQVGHTTGTDPAGFASSGTESDFEPIETPPARKSFWQRLFFWW